MVRGSIRPELPPPPPGRTSAEGSNQQYFAGRGELSIREEPWDPGREAYALGAGLGTLTGMAIVRILYG